MLKILVRTLVVILVIALVGGAVYLIGNKSGSSLSNGTMSAEGGSRPQMDANGSNQGQPPSGEGFESREGGQGSARGLSDLGVILAKIAGITVVITLIQWVIKLIQRRKKTPSASAA